VNTRSEQDFLKIDGMGSSRFARARLASARMDKPGREEIFSARACSDLLRVFATASRREAGAIAIVYRLYGER
jgi:hypothetical protein